MGYRQEYACTIRDFLGNNACAAKKRSTAQGCTPERTGVFAVYGDAVGSSILSGIAVVAADEGQLISGFTYDATRDVIETWADAQAALA